MLDMLDVAVHLPKDYSLINQIIEPPDSFAVVFNN
jgi:hypothetical protein